MAIEWVHDNIDAFGGDPDNVTIFGESAGSASVIYQGLYQGNIGLFQRIIAQSGSVNTWWGSTNKGLHYAKVVGSIANCSTTSSDAIVTCLRKIPAQLLMDLVSYPPADVSLPQFVFVPSIDNDFLTYDPKHVFDSRNIQSKEAVHFFASLDLLTGVNAGEGITALDPMFGVTDMFNFLPNRSDFDNTLVPLLIKEGYGEDVSPALKNVIIAEYTNWADPDNSSNIRDEYIRMHGDLGYNANLYKTLDTHSIAASTKKSYMYYLDIEPETHIVVDLPYYKKAVHADDLPLLFGYKPFTGGPALSPAEWELMLSEAMMTLWTNFAKTGDPNSPIDLGLNWEPYTTEGQHYLQIVRNMTSSNVKQRWNIGAPYFWFDVVPSITQLKTCEENDPDTTSSAGSVLLSGIRPFAWIYMFLLILTIAVSILQK